MLRRPWQSKLGDGGINFIFSYYKNYYSLPNILFISRCHAIVNAFAIIQPDTAYVL